MKQTSKKEFTVDRNGKMGVKLPQGPAQEAVRDIAKSTHRNITGSIEFLLLKGYEQFKREEEFVKKHYPKE